MGLDPLPISSESPHGMEIVSPAHIRQEIDECCLAFKAEGLRLGRLLLAAKRCPAVWSDRYSSMEQYMVQHVAPRAGLGRSTLFVHRDVAEWFENEPQEALDGLGTMQLYAIGKAAPEPGAQRTRYLAENRGLTLEQTEDYIEAATGVPTAARKWAVMRWTRIKSDGLGSGTEDRLRGTEEQVTELRTLIERWEPEVRGGEGSRVPDIAVLIEVLSLAGQWLK